MSSVTLYSASIGPKLISAEWRKGEAPCVATYDDGRTESVRRYSSSDAAISAARAKVARLMKESAK